MRIYLTLNPDECRMLGELSRRDMRHPKDQLRYLLRKEAARLNLLPNDERGTYATEAERRAA